MKRSKYLSFEVDDVKYRTGRIDAISQLGLSMKLGALLPVLAQVRDYSRLNPGMSLGNMDAGMLGILGKAMSDLPDDARHFIVGEMMGVVDRDETGNGNWLPVWDSERKTLMHDDMDLRSLILLAVKVFQFNMESFTSALGLKPITSAA